MAVPHPSQMNAANKSVYLFFIKFLLLFALLYLIFPLYWGITGPGGKVYSPFLDNHFNFIKGLAGFLTGVSRLLLNVFGYETFSWRYNSLRIGNSRGVVVNPSCLGWAVMSFWVAFVYANTGTVKHKLKWMLVGCITIICLNISRIVLIVLANHHNWDLITNLDHHQTFNIVSYFCVFILMYFYTRAQKRYEQMFVDAKDTSNNSRQQIVL